MEVILAIPQENFNLFPGEKSWKKVHFFPHANPIVFQSTDLSDSTESKLGKKQKQTKPKKKKKKEKRKKHATLALHTPLTHLTFQFFSQVLPTFLIITPASAIQNIGCSSIMTPLKMGKRKNLIFYSLNIVRCINSRNWN